MVIPQTIDGSALQHVLRMWLTQLLPGVVIQNQHSVSCVYVYIVLCTASGDYSLACKHCTLAQLHWHAAAPVCVWGL